MNEYELLTPEEKKYLERIARYLQSMGEKQVEIRIEANDWDNKTEISDIEWEHVTHFDWNSRLDIPSGFITCLLYTSPSPRDRQKSRMPSSA